MQGAEPDDGNLPAASHEHLVVDHQRGESSDFGSAQASNIVADMQYGTVEGEHSTSNASYVAHENQPIQATAVQMEPMRQPSNPTHPFGKKPVVAADLLKPREVTSASAAASDQSSRPFPLGNGRFCCCGVCVCPSDAGIRTSFLAFLVIAPAVVFCVSVVEGEWWSLLVVIILTVWALFMLLFATSCDPGILPKYESLIDNPHFDARTHVDADGFLNETLICRTCFILRPPRSGHCSFCDVCVAEYDHHCGVLGSCVGARTFRFFSQFMYATTLLAAYVLARTIAVIATLPITFTSLGDTDAGRWRQAAMVGCIMYTLLGGCMVIGQTMLYCQLSCTGMTQKDLFGSRRLELSSGCDWTSPWKFIVRMCGPMAPSQLNAV